MWDQFVARESAVVIVASMGNNNNIKTLDSDTYLNGGGSGKFIDDRTLPFNQPLKQD